MDISYRQEEVNRADLSMKGYQVGPAVKGAAGLYYFGPGYVVTDL